MQTLILKDLVTSPYLANDGMLLFCQMDSVVKNQGYCEVSFQDFDAISSSFYNASIGNFIDNYGIDYLRKHVKFINVTKSQGKWLHKYISDQLLFSN
jgi:hypothetical protein